MQILKVIKHLNYSKQYDDYSPFVIVFNDEGECERLDCGCFKSEIDAQKELDEIAGYIVKRFSALEDIIESTNV